MELMSHTGPGDVSGEVFADTGASEGCLTHEVRRTGTRGWTIDGATPGEDMRADWGVPV